MKTVFRGTCALALVLAVSNCGQLKEKLTGGGTDASSAADATAAAADVDSAAQAAPTATVAEETALKISNANDVARFPDETKLDNVVATFEQTDKVREVPQTGKVVATLGKGTHVWKMAQRGQYFLVAFDDAKDPSSKLVGWVHQNAFTAATVVADAGDAGSDGGAKPLTCAKGETPLFSDSPFCGKTCKTDADCGTGSACKGIANKLVNGKAGDAVPICTMSVVHDAGATATPGDAGTKLGGGLKLVGPRIIDSRVPALNGTSTHK